MEDKIKTNCVNCLKLILAKSKNKKYCSECKKIINQNNRDKYNKVYLKSKKFKDYCKIRSKVLIKLKNNHLEEYNKLFEKIKNGYNTINPSQKIWLESQENIGKMIEQNHKKWKKNGRR